MKRSLLIPLILAAPLAAAAQHVSTSDYTNFFIMRDSVLACPDSTTQLNLVNHLYINKASEGLLAFMRNKEGLDRKWLKLIQSESSFWDSLAGKSALVMQAAEQLENHIKHLRILYPPLKPAKTFFLVGLRQQGGTVRGNLSIIGTEVVMSPRGVTERRLVHLAVHEYIHTQQSKPDFQKIDVLTSAIREGACDFIASLVTGFPINEAYTQYGRKHEKHVWRLFQKEMYTTNNDNWVSTGNNPALPAPDLGYFVGYRICESYYNKATDKNLALAEIIQLDFSKKEIVTGFLKASGYRGK